MKVFPYFRYLFIASLAFSISACTPNAAAEKRASENQPGTFSPAVEFTGTAIPTQTPLPTATSTSTPEPTPTATLSGELKIGVIAPLTGNISSYGAAAKNGISLAVEEWNAKGGVLGMRVVPVFENSQCDVLLAQAAVKRLIEKQQVHYIIGDFCSKSSIAVSEVAEAAEVIQISPTSTNPLVTVSGNGKVKDYIFRACFIDSFQGLLGSRFASEKLKAQTAFVMYDPSNVYVSSLAKAFIGDFQNSGGKIVGQAQYEAKKIEIPAILDQIETTKPDLVYFPDYYDVVGKVMAQAHKRGLKVPFMGGDGWDTSEANLSSVYDGYFTNHYDLGDTDPLSQAFTTRYAQKFSASMVDQHTETMEAALAYDTFNLVATAIQNSGVDDTAKVKSALETISFTGVSGSLTFDKNHDPIKPGIVVHVENGRRTFFARVTP